MNEREFYYAAMKFEDYGFDYSIFKTFNLVWAELGIYLYLESEGVTSFDKLCSLTETDPVRLTQYLTNLENAGLIYMLFREKNLSEDAVTAEEFFKGLTEFSSLKQGE